MQPTHTTAQLQLDEDENAVLLRSAWDHAVKGIEATHAGRNMDNFIRPLCPVSFDGQAVVMSAPTAFAREWAEKKYAELIRAELQAALPGARPLHLRFVIAKPGSANAAPVPSSQAPVFGPPSVRQATAPKASATAPSTAQASSQAPSQTRPSIDRHRDPLLAELAASTLNPSYTFGNLIVGKPNRMAEAGARAVADAPGILYQPLFIYGAPGLGKTHLMHAIGNRVRETRPDSRVAFVSAEIFTNHFVGAIREKRTEEFRRAYRAIDVLLIDDIQMIASREQTKEEFFHTFNALYQTNKQIVITSDRSPRELHVDERLRTRFEAGLTVDVGMPDYEMRAAIILQRAEREGIQIDDDAAGYIATIVQTSTRSLEGAVIKVIAYASLTGSPITKQLASDALASYYAKQKTQPPLGASSAQVIDAVAVSLSLDRSTILSTGNRQKQVTRARQVAMYLCRELTPDSMSALATTFGVSSHAAISHAHSRMRSALDADPALLGVVANVRKALSYAG